MHRIIASTGARTIQKDEKLRSNVMASAQAHTHFLESERVTRCMNASSFGFEELKAKPMTIYLVLPADRLNAFGRWLRLLVQQAVTVNARNIVAKPAKPVLFILDEFAALGRLTMIEQAYGLMAGYGIQLWGIVQDFNQLERLYDKGWQSFVANAGMINYFGSSDRMTSEYFSALCGETTVWSLSSAIAHTVGYGAGGASSSESNTDTRSAAQRKLIFPDELMRLKGDQQLVLIENMHPLKAKRERWFDNPILKPLGVDLYAEADEVTEPETPTAEEALAHG
ncbi:MAG: type IV secretory system conjugative DNA transfer family protein [Pseudomonadota bacterium]